MRNSTVLALVVTAAVVYLVLRQRATMTAAAGSASGIVPAGSVDWIPTPEAEAGYWAARAGGTPSTAGSTGAGEVNPVSALLDKISRAFGGNAGAWGAPTAGTNPVQQLAGDPAGAIIPPGPVPPAQPTPQSAVSSDSPWLPLDFMLTAPVAASPWFMDLSLADPYALLAYKGGYIDAERISPLALG